MWCKISSTTVRRHKKMYPTLSPCEFSQMKTGVSGHAVRAAKLSASYLRPPSLKISGRKEAWSLHISSNKYCTNSQSFGTACLHENPTSVLFTSSVISVTPQDFILHAHSIYRFHKNFNNKFSIILEFDGMLVYNQPRMKATYGGHRKETSSLHEKTYGDSDRRTIRFR